MVKLPAVNRLQLVVGDRQQVAAALALHIFTLMNGHTGKTFRWGLSGGERGEVYEAFRGLVSEGRLNRALPSIRLIAMNEYVGADGQSARVIEERLRVRLLEPLGIRREHCLIPFGDVGEPLSDGHPCRRYQDMLESTGGVHLQLLEPDENGAYGFNFARTPFGARARVVRLPETTEGAEEISGWGWTSGPEYLMKAEEVHVLLLGSNMAGLAAKLFRRREFDSEVPCSVVHHHQNTMWWVDTEAASELAGRLRKGAVSL